ncbi:MAG TPA: hypothetical protein PKC28_02080 [Bdellovibrionales bacterium]|nr:hypothetical protein [Bdellovibrionales bacterium]
MKWIFVALATLLSSGLSHAAVVPADHMTCSRAIDDYERYGRIYVIAHGKDVVPIYGMAPVRRWREVTCRGRGKSRLSYWVNTLDDETCVIAVYCG